MNIGLSSTGKSWHTKVAHRSHKIPKISPPSFWGNQGIPGRTRLPNTYQWRNGASTEEDKYWAVCFRARPLVWITICSPVVRPCATPLNFRPVLSRNWKDLVNLPSLLVPAGESKKREGLTYSKRELELPAIVWGRLECYRPGLKWELCLERSGERGEEKG